MKMLLNQEPDSSLDLLAELALMLTWNERKRLANVASCLLSSPNGASLVHWPRYSKERREYLELGFTQTLRQNLKEDGFHFMTVVLPQRLKQQATAGAV